MQEADDVAQVFKAVRQEKDSGGRRKIRSLVRRDLDPIGLTSLPDSIGMARAGRRSASAHSRSSPSPS